MAKRFTVLDFSSQFGAAGDDIPVVIRRGMDVIGRGKSLYWLAAHGAVDILESKITFVTLKTDVVIIQVK